MQAMREREREGNQTVARMGATADKQTKYPSLSGDGGEGVAHRRNSDSRPVHPNQTKKVKG